MTESTMSTTLEKTATAIALIGLSVSAAVHAMVLLGASAPAAAVVYGLFAGAALSQVLAMVIAPRPTSPEPWTKKELRDAVLDAAPLAMRAGFYALLGYAFVQFAHLVTSFERSTEPFLTSAPGLRLFSSFWLVLYFAALTACTAARRTRQLAAPR